jgi:sucrose-6-phosphate hydrolase SacC (GH32 family)
LYELAVDGNAKDTRWVAWGATGHYLLGKFDGKDFKPEGGTLRHYFGAAYAGQTYSNAPEGRRVHIGWMRDEGPVMAGMPFNLQMTLPMEFTLRHDGAGALRLWAEPVKEIETQREPWKEWKDLSYEEGRSGETLADFKEGCYEVAAAELGFQIGGEHPAVWKRADQSFSGMEGAQAPVDGKLRVKIFVDTVSMEVFVNGSYVARYIRQKEGAQAVWIVAGGGAVKFDALGIYRIKPVWK